MMKISTTQNASGDNLARKPSEQGKGAALSAVTAQRKKADAAQIGSCGVPKAVSRIGPATQARAAEIARRLRETYPGDPTPFLHFTSPYECVVAVSLSAQTTDENVNRVLPTLFACWPDAYALSQASQEELEECVHSLGFFRNKAKNLRAMAQLVVAEFNGQIPCDMDALLRLPGVARKTANIVLAESFGIVQGIAVDTHVFRI